ncbi:RusA family crossover junction endodeoxyribonuclease [Paenibacillus shenyangensis]|uniref:RusA family crossover junction endodeoxyribonuclease n=1 Tax=Paenibacillus sp. A9 TaxID=1284352 RepID=UPI0003756A08|nr:RusA family crossover junction endodeoxyribonuclease [Paenibacillus sp. A9]
MNRLILPGTAPSVNHMYEDKWIRGRKIRIKTPEAEAWYQEAVLRAKMWIARNRWQQQSGKVYVLIWVFFPDKRRRDPDNGLKALLDALEDAGIYTDDKTALPHIMDYETDPANPRLEIEFKEYKSYNNVLERLKWT